jgi:hypothetical protein
MTEHRSNGGTRVPAAFLIALALGLAGWFVGNGFSVGRATDRYVTVKGVAEREVKADLALWPIRLASTDDDLSRAQQRINQNLEKVYAFLAKNQIARERAELQGLKVTDTFANPYQQGRTSNRFIIQQTLMVRTTDRDKVRAASQNVGELVDAGVVLSSGPEYGPGGPTFLFTGLNDLKPQMIAEATAQARKAAEQFARDSASDLGGIRRANQGVFQILPRDQAQGVTEQSQLYKKVRVVSTIEYLLEG